MTRRKPSYREQIEQANAADRFYAALSGKQPMMQTPIAPKRERKPVDPNIAEAGVMQDVGALLQVHPNVMMAVRQNAGAMAYQDAKGSLRPVWFYQWVRRPVKMRITDFWGFMKDMRPFALEAKRRDWKGPSDEREFEQEAFLNAIRSLGGIAGFVRNVDEAKALLDD